MVSVRPSHTHWLLLMVLIIAVGCGSTVSQDTVERSYLHPKSKTHYLFVGKSEEILNHSKIREEKLSMGAYCSTCQKWHALPPMEVVQRQPKARLCPKTKTPLSFEGPVPESVIRIEVP